MRMELFSILVLSLIACSIILYNIQETRTKVRIYDTANNLRKRLYTEMAERLPECCKESTKECFACATGTFVEDFCKRHSGEFGCPKINDSHFKYTY